MPSVVQGNPRPRTRTSRRNPNSHVGASIVDLRVVPIIPILGILTITSMPIVVIVMMIVVVAVCCPRSWR
jgi:hypothetical protein